MTSSTADPMAGARGNMVNPGTKQTPIHLANKEAPGLRARQRASPDPGTSDAALWEAPKRVVGLERELEVPLGEPAPGGEILEYGVVQLRRP